MTKKEDLDAIQELLDQSAEKIGQDVRRIVDEQFDAKAKDLEKSILAKSKPEVPEDPDPEIDANDPEALLARAAELRKSKALDLNDPDALEARAKELKKAKEIDLDDPDALIARAEELRKSKDAMQKELEEARAKAKRLEKALSEERRTSDASDAVSTPPVHGLFNRPNEHDEINQMVSAVLDGQGGIGRAYKLATKEN